MIPSADTSLPVPMMNPLRQDEEEDQQQQEPMPVDIITANQNLSIVIQKEGQNAWDPPPPSPVRTNFTVAPGDFASARQIRIAPPAPKPEPPPPPAPKPPPHFRIPFVYRGSSSAVTIERVPQNLREIARDMRIITDPAAVAIGPYHRFSPRLAMQPAKDAAVEEFCRAARQPREAVHGKMLSLAGAIRRCYDDDVWDCEPENDAALAEMMVSDGCFLLQFVVSMCLDDDPPPEPDALMARPEVYRRTDAIARDIFLLDNQIPWFVLEELMKLRRPSAVPVDKFLALMASAFDIGNIVVADDSSTPLLPQQGGEPDGDRDQPPPPPHLLGLFHRRQVGAPRTQSLRVPSFSSLSSTAVELAEMGVKLSTSKTKKFGDMAMSKRRQPLGIFGELSLAPVILNDLTVCWLFHMAAYEACLGPTRADNFAVSSYISVVSLLVNQPEDVQELRAKGLVVSAYCNEQTLHTFKLMARELHVGHRYYDVFKCLQEYRQERWIWIAVHKFCYNNFKTIVTVLSVAGVLVGLFKTILSLKQPHQG
ncbi:unnamed protein product [Urochloa humidicola]